MEDNSKNIVCLEEVRCCTDCDIEKPKIEEFFRLRKNQKKEIVKYFFQGHCADCDVLKRKLYREDNKDKIIAYKNSEAGQEARIRRNINRSIKGKKDRKEAKLAKLVRKTKICFKCGNEKENTEEFFPKWKIVRKNGKISEGLSDRCTVCRNLDAQEYKRQNIEKYKDSKKLQDQRYYQNNKERLLALFKTPKYKLIKSNSRKKNKLIGFAKVRKNISTRVNEALKTANGSKMGQSIFKYIGYTTQQLKDSIEAQFTNEMHWDNYGYFWHLDHIIPHSLFDYDILDCQTFKDCWALENLRPLEAKQNIIEGAARIRHKMYKEELNKRYSGESVLTIGEIIKKMEELVKNAESEENKE